MGPARAWIAVIMAGCGGEVAGGSPSTDAQGGVANAPPSGGTGGRHAGGSGGSSTGGGGGAAGAGNGGNSGGSGGVGGYDGGTTGGSAGTGDLDAAPDTTGGDTGMDAGSYQPTGVYDPGEVYLWGTLQVGACYRDAVAHWREPNHAATGFTCGTPDGTARPERGLSIRPADGRLVFFHASYAGKPSLRVFVPDGNGTGAYPMHPQDNDPIIPLACDEPSDYFVDPESGDVVYACGGTRLCTGEPCSYYRESGDAYEVPAGYYLLHLGLGESALLETTGAALAIRHRGQVLPVRGAVSIAASWSKSVVRAHARGFWVLKDVSRGASPERWNIALDGTATLDGKYPDPTPPTSYGWPTTEGDWTNCAFESGGAALCFAENSDNPLDDRIVRLELGKPSAELVYTESTFPLVKIHISYLFTGP